MLFADLSGSTSLYEKLGDQRALTAVESVLTEMRKSISLHQGRVVKTIGDEIMAVLPSPDAAMQAACDIQTRVSAIAPIDNVRLAVRVGFHYGPAIEEGGDFFGDAVNTAARMTGLAKGGQIITTSATVEALSPLLRSSTRDLDAMSVRGKQDEIRIFEVLWQDSDDLTTMASRDAPASQESTALTLIHGGRSTVLNASRPTLTMGREPGNDLVVADKMASRVHCKVEYRRGRFFLVDQSTNGTYLTIDSDPELMVKREQTMLRGRGIIAFGHTASVPGSEVVSFVCA